MVRVGTCVFVMRLLASVTGEKSEAMYVWHKCWRVPFLKRKKIERKDFQYRTRKLNKIQWDPETRILQLFAKLFERSGTPGMFVKKYRFTQIGHAESTAYRMCAWTTVITSSAG